MKEEQQQLNENRIRRRKYDLVNFTKMHGLGNDFMVVETLSQRLSLEPGLIQAWADRRTGIGFDQLLVLSAPSDPAVDFQYTIYNSDGSEAGQCGNGARAIARFIYDQKLSLNTENKLATSTNVMTVRLLESGLAQVDMDTPEFTPTAIPFAPLDARILKKNQSLCQGYSIQLNTKTVEFYPVSVGNPHAVIFLDNIDTLDEHQPHAIQQSSYFPEGVNVGYAQILNAHEMRLRVFERGVGETQACGSGATAAAIAALESGRLTGPDVKIELLGGALAIHWDGESLQMTGPATRVFTGRILLKQH